MPFKQNAILVLITTLIFSQLCYSQSDLSLKIDSLQNRLSASIKDEEKIKVLSDLAFLSQNTNPNKGIEYGLMAIKLAELTPNDNLLATAEAMTGMNYGAIGNFKEAIFHETKALELYQMGNNKKGEAAMLANLSSLYTKQGDQVKALEYALEAFKIYEEQQLRDLQAHVLDNIGTIYFRRKKYEKALNSYQLAHLIYKELNNKSGLARTIGNQGLVYNEQKKYDKALNRFVLAQQINRQIGSKRGEEVNLANIGNTHLYKEDLDSALFFYRKSMLLAKETDNKVSVAGLHGNMGKVFLAKSKKDTKEKNKNIELAEEHLNQSIKESKMLGVIEMQREFLPALSELFEIKHDYKRAIELMHQYNRIKDSTNSLEIEQRLYNLELNRDMELMNKNIQLKEQELEIKKLEINNYRFKVVLLLLVVCSFCASVFYLSRKLAHQKKANKILESENAHHTILINKQVADLEKHSLVLKEMAYMQAHHVRGPVSTIQGLIQLFNKNDLNAPDNKYVIENLESVVNKLDDAVKSVINKEKESRDLD